jgi:hypothetical protein
VIVPDPEPAPARPAPPAAQQPALAFAETAFQPPRVQPAAPAAPQRAQPAQARSGKSKSAGPAPAAARATQPRAQFRETMWFKKGEIDEVTSDSPDGGDASPAAPELPIEERYKDDGTITRADHERLSLQGGGTPARGVRAPRQVVPGERMAPEDIVGELSSGRARLIWLGVGAVVLAAAVLVYLFVLRR